MAFDLTEFNKIFGDSLEDSTTEFRMGHFTSAEHDCHLDLVSLAEEAFGILDFALVIMFVGFGPQLDFL